jgi:hypothetical protein
MADRAASGRSQSAGPSRGTPPTSGAETSLSGPGDGSRSQILQLRTSVKELWGCPACSKGYSRKTHTRRHIRATKDRKHQDQLPILNSTRCSICKADYKTIAARSKHEGVCQAGEFIVTTQQNAAEGMATSQRQLQAGATILDLSSNLHDMDWSSGDAFSNAFRVSSAVSSTPWHEQDWIATSQDTAHTDTDADCRLLLNAEPFAIEGTLAGDPTTDEAFQKFSILAQQKSGLALDVFPWGDDVLHQDVSVSWAQYNWDEINKESSRMAEGLYA